MKKEARILKRERQRVAYENEITELAEKKLLGKMPVVAAPRTENLTEMLKRYGINEQTVLSWAKPPGGVVAVKSGRIYFDCETTGLRGVSATHFVHDEIIVTFDEAAHACRVKAEEVLHVQAPPQVPAMCGRSGQFGAVTLRVPGAKGRLVATTDPTKKALLEDFINEVFHAGLVPEL
jgi:hypothetical protein